MRIFTRTKHISDKALESYVLRDLCETEREQVTEHMANCSYCLAQYRGVQELITVLGLSARDQSASMLAITH